MAKRYNSKSQLLEEFLENNPEFELPYDTIQLNYDHLKREVPNIEWDSMLEPEPSFLEVGWDSFSMAAYQSLKGMQAFAYSGMGEIFQKIPNETFQAKGRAGEWYSRETLKELETWREGLADNPKYASTITYLAEHPYSDNKTSWKHQANMAGEGLASVLQQFVVTGAVGTGMYVRGAGKKTIGIASLFASGASMFGMAGGAGYAETYEWHNKDREITQKELNEDILFFKNSELYRNTPDGRKGEALRKFLDDEYIFKHRSENLLDVGYNVTTGLPKNLDNKHIIKKGLSPEESNDIALNTGLAIGLVESGIETTLGWFSNRLMGVIPDLGLDKNLRKHLFPNLSSKMARNIRVIPKKYDKTAKKVGQYFNRMFSDNLDDAGNPLWNSVFDYNPANPNNFGKVVVSGVGEGITELTQEVSSKLVANAVGGRQEDPWDTDDMFRAFHGGFVVGGGMVTARGTGKFFKDLGSKNETIRKIIDAPRATQQNMHSIRASLETGEQLFYYDKDEKGYFIGIRGETPEGEVKGYVGEDYFDPDLGVKDRMSSKLEAQETIRKLNKSARNLAIRTALEKNLQLRDGTVYKEKMEDGKFKVEIRDKDGNVIDEGVFDKSKDADKVATLFRSNIKQVNKKAEENPDIVKDIELNRQTGTSKTDAKLVLDDLLNEPLDSKARDRLAEILPEDEKELTKKRIDDISALTPEDVDGDMEKVQAAKEQLIEQAAEQGINLNPDELFSGKEMEAAAPIDIDIERQEIDIVPEEDIPTEEGPGIEIEAEAPAAIDNKITTKDNVIDISDSELSKLVNEAEEYTEGDGRYISPEEAGKAAAVDGPGNKINWLLAGIKNKMDSLNLYAGYANIAKEGFDRGMEGEKGFQSALNNLKDIFNVNTKEDVTELLNTLNKKKEKLEIVKSKADLIKKAIEGKRKGKKKKEPDDDKGPTGTPKKAVPKTTPKKAPKRATGTRKAREKRKLDRINLTLDIDKRVLFPPVPGGVEPYALIDGIEVTLTKDEQEKLSEADKRQKSSILAEKGKGQAALRDTAVEIFERHMNSLNEDELAYAVALFLADEGKSIGYPDMPPTAIDESKKTSANNYGNIYQYIEEKFLITYGEAVQIADILEENRVLLIEEDEHGNKKIRGDDGLSYFIADRDYLEQGYVQNGWLPENSVLKTVFTTKPPAPIKDEVPDTYEISLEGVDSAIDNRDLNNAKRILNELELNNDIDSDTANAYFDVINTMEQEGPVPRKGASFIYNEVSDDIPESTEFVGDNTLVIVRKSPFSGKKHKGIIKNVTEEQFARYILGEEMLQQIFPNMPIDQREFIINGIPSHESIEQEKREEEFEKELEEKEKEIKDTGKLPQAQPGDVVQYNGKFYILWNINASKKAQLTKTNGDKFSGTPNMDKITYIKTLPRVTYNGNEFVVDKTDRIFSLANGKEVYSGKDESSKKMKQDILNLLPKLPSEDKKLKTERPSKLIKLGLGTNLTTISWVQDVDTDGLMVREEYRGATPYERIVLGEKTGHSLPVAAIKANKIQLGDIILFTDEVTGKTIHVQITSEPIPVEKINEDVWSTKEGWAADSIEDGFFNNYAQFDFRIYDPNQMVIDLDTNINTLPVKEEIEDDIAPPELKIQDDDIFHKRNVPLNLTVDQKLALLEIKKGLDKDLDARDNKPIIITGYAGTGKTTIIENIAKEVYDRRQGQVYLAALTNKAVLRLQEATNEPSNEQIEGLKFAEYSTIHSLLYGAPDEYGVFKVSQGLEKGDVLVIDEASMVGSKMMKALEEKVLSRGAKLILIGDPFQLLPINDQTVLDKSDFQLTHVQRQGLDSSVLKIATAIRTSQQIILPKESSLDGEFTLMDNVEKAFLADLKKNGSAADIAFITDKNKPRVQVNMAARNALYGDWAFPIQDNERIIYVANSLKKKNGAIENVNTNAAPLTFLGKSKLVERPYLKAPQSQWRTHNIELYEDENSGEILILVPQLNQAALFHGSVLERDNFELFNNYGLSTMKIGGEGIRALSTEKNNIATYGYAITAHKAQGSEWDKVYIRQSLFDNKLGKNIYSPQEIWDSDPKKKEIKWDHTRWLYTALTRGKRFVYLENNSSYDTYGDRKSWEEINEINNPTVDNIMESIYTKAQEVEQSLFTEFIHFMHSKFIDDDGTPMFKIVKYYDPKSTSGGSFTSNKKLMRFNTAKPMGDTPFHEFAHPFISWLRIKNPELFNKLYDEITSTEIGKINERIWRKVYTDPKFLEDPGHSHYKDENVVREEIMVKMLGRAMEKEYMRKNYPRGAINKFKKAVKDIVDAIKNFIFGPNVIGSDAALKIEDLGDIENLNFKALASIIINAEKINLPSWPMGKNLVDTALSQSVNNMVMESIISPDSVARNSIERELNRAYNIVENYWKRKKGRKWIIDPLEFRDIIQSFIVDDTTQEIFTDWFNHKFGNNDLLNDLVRDDIIEGKKKYKFINDFTDWGKDGPEYIWEGLNEGLRPRFEDRDFSSIAGSATMEMEFHNRLGITLKPDEINLLTKLGYTSTTFDSFYMKVIDHFGKNLFAEKDMELRAKSFYLLKRNSIRINRNEPSENQRDNFIVTKTSSTTGEVKATVSRKTEINIETKKTNPSTDRNTLLEVAEGNLLSQLSFNDSLLKVVTYDEISGIPNTEYREEYEFKLPTKESLYQSRLAIITTRGDSGIVLLAKIKEEYIDEARLIQEGKSNYWNKEIDEKRVSKEDVANYMKDKSVMGLAHEIAVHEAMIRILPQYSKYKLEEVIKRIKIPTAPVTTSNELRDYTVSLFDPENITFVKGSNSIKAMQKVIDVGYKYIGDGGTLTSTDFFTELINVFGIRPESSTAKTVIYSKGGKYRSKSQRPSINDDILMVKHNQFKPEKGTKIYENYGEANERLIAEVGRDGNIYLIDENGDKKYVDMLLTKDEAKIIEGKLFKKDFKESGFVTLKGQSLGFLKSHDKVPNFSRHLMQWYNHVESQGILDSFNNNMIPVIESNLRRHMSRYFTQTETNNVVNNIMNLFLKYEKIDRDNYYASAIEHAKLGIGLHPAGLPSLKNIIRNAIIKPQLRLTKMDGTKADIVPNFRGDLDTKEAAISLRNAYIVKEKVKKALGGTVFQDMSPDTQLQEINNYLRDNEVYALIARSPVPHDGGAQMVRIKRVHRLENQILLHHDMIFKMLEGDSDGDSVQIEFLPDDMTREYRKYLEKEIEGISLKNIKNKLPDSRKKLRFSDLSAREKMIDEIVTGTKAVGEIANIQTFYGVLRNTLDSVSFTTGIGVRKIVLRNPDEIVKIGKLKEPLGKSLRILLQAAVDNNKFMMLKAIGYDIDDLGNSRINVVKSKLFKYENGNDVPMEVILPIINLLSKTIMNPVHDIGRLGNREAQFTLEELYAMSESYNNFARNKDNWFRNKLNNAGINYDIKFKTDSEGNYILHPKESIAITLDNTRQSSEFVKDTKSENYGPWSISLDLHKNTHITALNIVTGQPRIKLLRNALERDGRIGKNQAENEKYMEKEKQKGLNYANALLKSGKEIAKKGLTSQVERSDLYKRQIAEAHEIFKGLSEVAKVYATLAYIGDGSLEASPLALEYMPPASSSNNQYSNLDYRTLKEYFKEYNNIINDPKQRNYSKKPISVRETDDKRLIKEVCSFV